MQYFIFSLLSILFLYLNFQILKSDIQKKIIPNIFLLGLLCLAIFFYGYRWYFGNLEWGWQLFSPFLALLISFGLYYFGIWSAGDAKYLFVLSFFLISSSVFSFIVNIALGTLLYLLAYFLYFLGTGLFHPPSFKNLSKNIVFDLSQKWKYYKSSQGKNTKSILLNWGISFVIIFSAIRFLRLYLFEGFEEKTLLGFLSIISHFMEIPVLAIMIIIFIGIVFFIRYALEKIKYFLLKKTHLTASFLEKSLLSTIFFSGSIFLFFQYLLFPEKILHELFLVFCVYGVIFLVLIFLKYASYIVFSLQEYHMTPIENLQVGDRVDKQYLQNLFGRQSCLGMENNNGLLSPSPSDYFQNIENPLDEETKEMLQKVYQRVNSYHIEKNTLGFTHISHIKTLRTFPFGGFIFGGFLVTFFFGGHIFSLLLEKVFSGISQFFL